MNPMTSLVSGLVVAVGVAAGAGCAPPTAAANASPELAPTKPALSADGAVERVTAAPPERKTMQLFTTQPGRIEAFESAPLFPKLAGYVESVLVDIGDAVKKDQVLLQLAIPELHDELEQREALVAQAEAEIQQAEAAAAAAEAAVHSAQARVAQAEASTGRTEAEYARWQSEHARIKDLAERGSVTPKLVDETLSQFRAAEAARVEVGAHVESARAGAQEAQARLATSRADIVAARAKLRVAQANRSQARTMLQYTTLRAPFAGVVTQRGVDTGHYVQPGGGQTTPLLTVERTDRLRVSVDVPELESPRVDAGSQADTATIRVQALRNRSWDAKVARTGWSLDAVNRSLRTEFDVPNDEGLLRPGLYATVKILLERRAEVLTLPVTAVIIEGSQASCCVVDSGRIVRQPITLGLRSGDEVEITSGLEPAQVVVLARAEALRPGQAVEVIPPEKK
ncbi:MAG: efflux RND transporter periplasmic adaptor subunit [Pirellulaceae bacterium]